MPSLQYKCDGNVASITIQRPEVRNALDLNTLKALLEAITQARASGARALILTGEGSLAFSAGADIREIASYSSEEMLTLCQTALAVANALESASFPTIAAINGHALGGGFEIALACDILYAVPTALLGLPEVKLGLIPGWGGVQRLIRAVGFMRAKAFMLQGKLWHADEAYQQGIIHAVVEPGELLPKSYATANALAAFSPEALGYLKSAIQAHGTAPPQDLYEAEAALCSQTLQTPSAATAIQQFLQQKDHHS